MTQIEWADALGELAGKAEELSALLFDAYPRQAEFWGKVAATARKQSTCMRIHGVLPDLKSSAPLVEAAKVATDLHRNFANVSRLFPSRGK